MRKIIMLVVTAALLSCMAFTGCGGSAGVHYSDVVGVMDGVRNASVTAEMEFNGSVTQVERMTPLTVSASGDGLIDMGNHVSDWYCDVKSEAFGDRAFSKYRMFDVPIDDEVHRFVRNAGGSSYGEVSCYGSSFVPLTIFKDIRDSISDESASVENTSDGGSIITFYGAADGDVLRDVVLQSFNMNGAYDTGNIKWTGNNAPVVIKVDSKTCLPISVSVDCGSVCDGIAGAVSSREGIKTDLQSFVVTYTYSDFNRYTDIKVPDELLPGKTELF